MALDPAARAAIKVFEEAFPVFPRIGTEVLDIAEVYRLAQQSPVLPAVAPRPLHRVDDLVIPGAPPLNARLYRPREGVLPLVLFLHGGGWVFGDLDGYDQLCGTLAELCDAVVVSVDYRLAPAHRFPAAVEDAYAVLAWCTSEGGQLGVDPGRIVVAGDSAGGNLAAALALMARDRGGPLIQLQLLLYPALDPSCSSPSAQENATGYFLTTAHMRWFWKQYLGGLVENAPAYAAPPHGDLSDLPPAHIVTCEYDPLRDEAENYGDLLRSAGVPVSVRRFDGMFHGFLGADADLLPAAADALDETSRIVHALLHGNTS